MTREQRSRERGAIGSGNTVWHNSPWSPQLSGVRSVVLVVLVAVALTVASGGTAIAGATDSQQDRSTIGEDAAAFVVEVHEGGDATVTVRYTFDLEEDTRQSAFEELRTNETAHEQFTRNFEDRLGVVATEASESTGREMSVTDATLTLETVDDTGVASLSVSWRSLAAVEGDQLVVTEPFTSGFESDRPLYVLAPSGYTIPSVTPEPDTATENLAAWPAGTDMTGFELTASPAEEESGDTDDTPTDDGADTGDSTTDDATDGQSADTTDGSDSDESGAVDDGGPGFGLYAVVGGALSLAVVLVARQTYGN